MKNVIETTILNEKFREDNVLLPCFSHWQLYVAWSRVGKLSILFIYVPDRLTIDIVHDLALRWFKKTFHQNFYLLMHVYIYIYFISYGIKKFIISNRYIYCKLILYFINLYYLAPIGRVTSAVLTSKYIKCLY